LIFTGDYTTKLPRLVLEDARAIEDKEKRMQSLEVDIKALKDSCVWPNGFQIGWLFFFIVAGLVVSTVLPPVLVLVVVTGIGSKVLSLLLKKKGD